MLCKSVIFVTVIFALYGGSCATKYSDCGSQAGSIVSVDVSNCGSETSRCILRRNSNATMVFSFKSGEVSESLTAVVFGKILSVDIPFPLPNPNACKDSGVACPVQNGATYKYFTTLPILGSYPRVTVDIIWKLQDAEGKDLVCVEIPAKLK